MREVISLNGEFPQKRAFAFLLYYPSLDSTFSILTSHTHTVGQAGCQIANSCWEVSNLVHDGTLAQIAGHFVEIASRSRLTGGASFTAWSMAFRCVPASTILFGNYIFGLECLLTRFLISARWIPH